MKRLFLGGVKKFLPYKLHFKIGFAVILFAIVLTFIIPHNAKAASPGPLHWVNKAYIQSDSGELFYDNNSFDDVFEFAQVGGGTCGDKVRFDGPSRFQNSTQRNIYFYYATNWVQNYYDEFTPRVVYDGQQQTSAAGNSSECIYGSSDKTTIAQPTNRRYTWWRNSLQGDGQSIKNIFTGVSFTKKTNFNNVERFFRDSEASNSSNVCPDMILLHRANPNASAEELFGSGDVAESSILFSVQNDSNLSRISESYDIDSEPNQIAPGTCHVRSQSLNKKDNGDMPQFNGDIKNDQYFLSSGLDASGNTNPNGDTDDDAFVTFIGNENNLPKNADGSTNVTPINQITDGGNADKVGDTCKGGALGWVICPLVSAMETTINLIKTVMESMLAVQPFKLDTSDPIYQVWDNFRNLANIVYIFAFFIIVFSQATSIGVSNYGIKRMLPKLIVYAILSNISYYICVAMVDFFNILGVGVENLVAIANGGNALNVEISNAVGFAGIASIGLAGTAIGALIYTGAIVELLPLLVTAFLAIIITLIVLALRQIIIIAIVASSAIIIALDLLWED